MTPEELSAWRKRLFSGYGGRRRAAEGLGVGRSTLWRYETGQTPMSHSVLRLVALLDEPPELRQLIYAYLIVEEAKRGLKGFGAWRD